MNREGKIYVKSNNTNRAIVATLKDSNQLTTAQNIQNNNSIISMVNLAYNFITLSDSVELLSIKQYKLKVGVNSFSNISFSNAPVLLVQRISLLSSTADVKNIKYGTNSVSFDVVTEKKETVDISITGVYIVKNNSKISVSNNTLVNEIGEVNLDVSSGIVQNADTAKSVANTILNIVSMKDSHYTVSSRGNPALELMDNIIIDDVSDRIYMAAVTILRQQITWDGSLSVDIEGRSLVGTNLYLDCTRKVRIKNNINFDSKVVIGNNNSFNTDTSRKVGKGLNANIDTYRWVIDVSISIVNIDTMRIISKLKNENSYFISPGLVVEDNTEDISNCFISPGLVIQNNEKQESNEHVFISPGLNIEDD
jgi:hypothetical protein